MKFVFSIRFSCLKDAELDQWVEAIKMDMPDVGQRMVQGPSSFSGNYCSAKTYS